MILNSEIAGALTERTCERNSAGDNGIKDGIADGRRHPGPIVGNGDANRSAGTYTCANQIQRGLFPTN
jgi:hypothetical protein